MSNRLPSLQALRAFECTARHLSFTKAANEMCVTIPALSHHIKALEDELGYPLFLRKHRAIDLTPEGEKLFETARYAFESLSNTWTVLSGATRELVLTTGQSFMANWLTYRLVALQACAPDVSIKHVTTFDPLNVNSGEADIALRHGRKADDGVFSDALYADWWAPMMSPELAARVTQPSDLLHLPIIEARDAREPRDHVYMSDWFRANGVNAEPGNYRQHTHTETAMQLAADGQGVKLCSDLLAHQYLENGQLVMPFRTAIRRKGFRYRLICRIGKENQEPVVSIRRFFHEQIGEMTQSPDRKDVRVVDLP